MVHYCIGHNTCTLYSHKCKWHGIFQHQILYCTLECFTKKKSVSQEKWQARNQCLGTPKDDPEKQFCPLLSEISAQEHLKLCSTEMVCTAATQKYYITKSIKNGLFRTSYRKISLRRPILKSDFTQISSSFSGKPDTFY